MKIYILDSDPVKIHIVSQYFKNDNIEFVCDTFSNFIKKYDIDCVVSPANSFGLMDGGYDLAITKHFGNSLQKRVQQYILDNYFGEQPIGTSIFIPVDNKNKSLIHTPTMRTPKIIKDPEIVYHCMRSTLICAIQNKIESIVIPLFGGGYGGVNPYDIGKYMYLAYNQISNPPKNISWESIPDIDTDII